MKKIREQESSAMPSRLGRALRSTLVRVLFWLISVCFCAVVAIFLANVIIGPTYFSSHGETLPEFVVGVDEEQYEYAAVFTSNGQKVIELTSNSPDHVSLPVVYAWYAQIAAQGEMVFVHNHPDNPNTGYPAVDVTYAIPSVGDLLTCLSIRPAQGLVVSGEYITCLEAPLGWPDKHEFCDYLEKVEDSLIASNRLIYYGACGYVDISVYEDLFVQMLDDFGLTCTAITVEGWLQSQQAN